MVGPLKCGSTNSAKLALASAKPYQEVRGFVRGVQYSSTDGFHTPYTSIDEAYVDGVSITVGSPRRHIWTYAAGLMASTGNGSCPCQGGATPPPFVGNSWTCDSGNPGPAWSAIWYTTNPLWDGDSQGAGCTPSTNPGWFQVSLPAPTADAIEVRVMFDDCDENVAISSLIVEVR